MKLAKAEVGEKIDLSVEDSMCGDPEVQESKGARSMFGPQGG